MLKPTMATFCIALGLVCLAIGIQTLFQRDCLEFCVQAIISVNLLGQGWFALRRAARKDAEGNATHSKDTKQPQQ